MCITIKEVFKRRDTSFFGMVYLPGGMAVMAQARWEGGLNEFDCECSPCTNEADQQGVIL